MTVQTPHILHSLPPSHPHTTHLVDERADELGLKDVAKGYPVEELEQCLQCGSYQGDALRVVLRGGEDKEPLLSIDKMWEEKDH